MCIRWRRRSAIYTRSTRTNWSIDALTAELGFLEIVSAKVKKVTQARPANASAFSINILGSMSYANGNQSTRTMAFAKQPDVKVQWANCL